MNISSAVALIVGFFLIYMIIVEIFTVLFRITGMSSEKASFQVISMLTNSGYTTTESELIVSNKLRRKLAKTTMLFGYTFTVIIVSLIINIFLSINIEELTTTWIVLGIGLAVLVLVLLLFRLKFVKRIFDVLVTKIAKKIMYGKYNNYINVIDNYGTMVFCEINITVIPESLNDKRLFECKLREDHDINVMLVKQNKDEVVTPKLNYKISVNDTLYVFGPSKKIYQIFNEVSPTN
ncbi:MAG: TrkA C-terminal domain-containing protein [Anaeroplasmataceae bacterium]